jgi:hypothetical protein
VKAVVFRLSLPAHAPHLWLMPFRSASNGPQRRDAEFMPPTVQQTPLTASVD